MLFLTAAASAPDQVPLFRTILDAQPNLGALQNLCALRTHLADRFLGSAGRPAERLSISGLGETHPTLIDFTDYQDERLSPEARGQAVLMHIAESLVPALQRHGADQEAAVLAAYQLAAQFGDREFAMLEQGAVQNASGQRMCEEPVSATHIVLKPHGEVLVHKSTQWAGYVDDTGRRISVAPRSGIEAPSVLKLSFVTAFRLERVDRHTLPAGHGADSARRIFANVDGRKQFALSGQVRHCLLETPDAALKALLTHRTTTLTDILLYGFARMLGRAGILIIPPAPLYHTRWATPLPRHSRDVVLSSPPDFLKVASYQIQAFRPGTRELDAALALGAYCQSMVSGLIPHSRTKTLVEAHRAQGEIKKKLLARARRDGEVVDRVREKLKTGKSLFENCLNLLRDSLAFATGDCLEMALVSAALAHSKARSFLKARGFANAEITVEIYEAGSSGDHGFCVLNLKINGFAHKIAIDPWADVSMLYEQYGDYVTTYPDHLYTREFTSFRLDASLSKTINREDYMQRAADILEKYLAQPQA